jgi:hypothetical protein
MKIRIFSALAALAALVVATYFASPYWTAWRIKSAAAAGDGERLASYVDFPSVRDSIRAQVQGNVLNPLESRFRDRRYSALGMLLAGQVANVVVDSMVTPENLASMVNRGKTKPVLPDAQRETSADTSTVPSRKPKIGLHYDGLDAFNIEMRDPDTDALLITWVMGRENLFAWRLKAIRADLLASRHAP